MLCIDMKVIDSSKVVVEKRSGGIFTGPVEIFTLVSREIGATELRAALVEFPAGVRNRFHTHTREQLLFVTEGEGIVASENETVRVKVGDIVFIPKGEKHWHGATEDGSFKHLYVVPIDSETSYEGS